MSILYRIKVLHGGPKSSHTATETFLVAESDEQVANWIEKEKQHGHWWTPYSPVDPEEEPETRYDSDADQDIPFYDYILKNRGDLEDEEGWSDAYYGVTKWGWEEVETASAADVETLTRLGIALLANNQADRP